MVVNNIPKNLINKKRNHPIYECESRNQYGVWFDRQNGDELLGGKDGVAYGDNFIVPYRRPIAEEFTFSLEMDLFQIADEIARKLLPQLPTRAWVAHHGNSQNEGIIEYYYGDMDVAEYTVRVHRDGNKLIAEKF